MLDLGSRWFPRFILGLALILLLPAQGLAKDPPKLPAGDDFGAPIGLAAPTRLSQVVEDPDAYAGRPVLLQGTVSDVCQRKGCWTVLRDGDAHVRIRFKDYGFFLPKDATGRAIYAEGTVDVKTLSEDEARHYEEESRDGKPDEVTGPRREVGFTASGVRLLPRN
jgi:hypothetical protein